jgi:NADH-quinone oxidoreductase subunit L
MISCLAIAGIFPFAGFFSKDEILAGAWGVHPPGWPPFYGKILWGGLLVAALGTAFYMWRLYFLVFSGKERSEEAKKAHESPASMTMPLVILALLATLAGLLGFPHLTGIKLPSFTHALSNWLAPSVTPTWWNPGIDGVNPNELIAGHASDPTILGLAAVALFIGALGIGLAWVFYGRGPSPAVNRLVDGPLAGAYEASKHKLWFDEIYDALIVKPFKVVANGLYTVVDKLIIDTIAVNGSAVVIGLFGRMSRWFQNGQVQRYLAGLVVGAALVFFVTDLYSKPTFDYEIVGERLKLTARPGAGLLGATTKVRWDIDGDGKADSDPATGAPYTSPELSVLLGDTRTRVNLFIDDPITRKTTKVTRVLHLPPVVTDGAPPQEGK